MASWDNGGRGVDGVNQIGVANPSTFFNSFFPTGFGSNSSSTSALPNPPAANTKGKFVGIDSFVFSRQTTANSDTFTSPVATQPPPLGSYQCGGGDHQLFRKNPGIGAFQNACPYGSAGFPFSGNLQFDSQFSFGSSAAATTSSPFGNESPSYSSSSSTFGTISSGFRSSTTGPFTRSLGQENSSANNVSVFAPLTRSNLGMSDIQGTRICSYASTPEADNIYGSGKLMSISAMPFYQEQSHEELRLEDCQLNGRIGPFTRSLGQENSSANNVSVFAPLTRSNLGMSDIQGTRICSYAPTPEADNIFGSGKLMSISAMPFYQEQSHEELRLEDCQLNGRTGPFTRSLGQENSSANNVSVFAPLTRSNLGMSDIQGTRICSYAPTPEADNIFGSGKLMSISAMPFYQEQSHEELRLEDCQLNGRTGPFTKSLVQENTSANNVSVFPPNTRSNLGISDIQGTRYCSYTADNVSVFPPNTRSNLGISDIQGTRYCSYTTTPVVDNNKYCEMISISAMPFYSNKSHEELRLEDYQLTERTGGFTPGFLCSTDNRQQPMSKCPVSDERTPPIEKYKPDDEDVMAMIPKLKCPEYYMEPSMEDLAASELKMPGFCCQVKDFVIGKRGYGSIKFLGETDVRNLDLESIVQFNNREVIVCMDKKNGKPPVGQGLNKAAEITLLNVNCIDKNTGKQYIDGPKVDKYKQLLMRKTADQGAELVSFDPAKGEWKFKVQHF